jgi:pilus biogenesis lipoprotein CpaD
MKQRIFLHSASGAFALAALLVLACCNSSDTIPLDKTPHIEKQVIAHRVLYANDVTQKISFEEYSNLKEFIASVPSSSVSNVLIVADESTPVKAKRLKHIVHYVTENGISRNIIHFQALPDNGNDIIVNIEFKKVIKAQNCPDWSSNPEHNYENAEFSNFGCANHNNIAVQVLNPSDLESGHGQNNMSAEHDGTFLQKYMAGTSQSTSPATSSISTSR